MNEQAFSSQEKKALYFLACECYEKEKYEKAAKLFAALTLSEPFHASYWKGLSSAQQLIGNYEEATQSWAWVCLLCESDPLPHFHAAECLLAAGNKQEAKKALNNANERLAQNDDELKKKITELEKVMYG